jgi:hypothetical protein
VDADLDTLVTALYVTTDDFLIDNPQHRPWRPKVGITPRLGDAELVTLAVTPTASRSWSWLRLMVPGRFDCSPSVSHSISVRCLSRFVDFRHFVVSEIFLACGGSRGRPVMLATSHGRSATM